VALCLARDVGDRVRGLLLVNPFCRPTAPAAVPLLRLALAPVVGEPVRRRLAPAIATGLVRWSLASACAPDPVPPAARALPCRTMAQESAVLAMAAELGAFTADMACLPRYRARVQSRILALSGAQDRVIEGEAHGAWLASRFGAEHRVTPGGHMLHHTRTALLVAALREFALD
jgi:pimeloyl-ACP methyl ester carboxylesterase